MTTQNDVTGDDIKSKVASNKYRDNWDTIFNKEKDMTATTTTYYANGTKTVEISEEEYNDLKDSQFKLECLESAGVDNWSGFSDAMSIYYEDEDEDE